MTRYSDDRLLSMNEQHINDLFEKGIVDDDTVQRWYDLRQDAHEYAQQFIKECESGAWA